MTGMPIAAPASALSRLPRHACVVAAVLAAAACSDPAPADLDGEGGEELWTREYPEYGLGVAVLALPAGGFVVAAGEPPDTRLLRFDDEGELVWEQSLSLADRTIEGLALSPSGTVLAVGSLDVEPELSIAELWVGEFSAADGRELWIRLPDIRTASNRGRAIAVDAQGGMRVTGLSMLPRLGRGSIALVAGLGPDGTAQWWRELPDLGEDFAQGHDVVVLPDGSAVFAGSTGAESWGSLWLQRIDAAGQQLWSTTQDSSSVVPVTLSLERPDDGHLLVSGTAWTDGGGTSQALVVLYDEDGNVQWQRTWNRADVANEWIRGTALADDGTLYFAATNNPGAYSTGLYGAFDDEARYRWSHIFTAGGVFGGAYDVAVPADGNPVFVGGIVGPDGTLHLWLRKTEP